MKMNPQNPGGEVHAKPTMKGLEKYMVKGQGSVLGGTLQTKGALAAPGMSGMAKGAHVRSTHAKSSMSGTTVTGTSKACK